MQSVASGIAVELGQPPFAPVGWSRAVLAVAMPMPETTVNEDDCLVLRQENVN
jgi:hypothetical protein